MNFLEKLDFMMEERGLNKNTLSKQCNIPYTTIDGWYKKGYEGLKLSSLRKLSSFFNVTIDFWVEDDSETHKSKSISNEEKVCLDLYQQLDTFDKRIVINLIEQLLKSDKYAVKSNKMA